MVAPKIPEDPEVVTVCREAYVYSKTDYKAAVAHLKAAVKAGTLPAAVQRAFMTWLANDGEWDEERSRAPEAAPNPQLAPPRPWNTLTLEEKRVKMMRDKKWSRKQLQEHIDDMGGDIDDLRNPQDDQWDEIMAKGPPAWFTDAVQKAEAEGPAAGKAALESAIAAGARAVEARTEGLQALENLD